MSVEKLVVNITRFLRNTGKSVLGDPFAGGRIRKMHVFRAIKSLAPAHKNYLDAGCGYGDYSFFLSRFPEVHVIGVDQDPNAISWCQKRKHELAKTNVDFLAQSLSEPLGNGAYDAIICIDVLDDIPDDVNTLHSFYEYLTAGGRLILHVPLVGKPRFFQGVSRFHYELSLREYRTEEILGKVGRAGFRVRNFKLTFGWAGSLARELWYEAWRVRENLLLKILIHPLIMILSFLDVYFPVSNGRGCLIIGEK